MVSTARADYAFDQNRIRFYYATDYDIDLTVQANNGIRTEVLVANIWVNEKGNAPEQGGSCGTDGGCGSASCSH